MAGEGEDIMKYETITVKGTGEWNEDALIENSGCNLYGVIDGVSSLVPYRSKAGETGGYLAAKILQTNLNSLTTIKDLKQQIGTCNQELHKVMKKEGIDLSKKEGLWGAAIALVHIEEQSITYLQTGDCMIIAVYEDGKTRVLTRPQVAHLEQRAFDKWRDGMEKGLVKRDHLIEYVRDIIVNNRYHSNVNGGYGVLNGEEVANDFLEYGKMNRDRLAHIILLTDGLFLPEEIVPSGEQYWDYVAKEVIRKGLKGYTNDLVALEETDPECIKYIRFKKSDDKTGIVINF